MASSSASQASAKESARKALESIGFDLNESKQFISYLNGLTKSTRTRKGAMRWVFLVLVGFGTGMVAVAISFLLHKVNHLRWHTQDLLFEAGYGLIVRFLVWLGSAMVLAAIAGYLVCFQQPLAAGSGIPEIKCVLNGIELPNVLRLRTLVCKALGIVCSVAAGLPCGKEGPMIHSGAIVAAQVQYMSAGPSLNCVYRLPIEARDFVAAGAAAGVAAAFGAPIGGVLFAVEEGASHMNPRILVRTFVCAAVAGLTVRTFSGPMEGLTKWGTLGTEVPVEFGRFPFRRYTLLELPVFALMGMAGGLLGALFNGVNTRLSRWRMRNIGAKGARRFLEVMLVTFAIVSFNFFAPFMTGAPDTKVSEYKEWQKLFLDLGGDGIQSLFHSKDMIEMPMLLFFAAVHYFQTIITYGLGVPSGLFVPSLLAGATFGRMVGQVMGSSHLGLFATTPGLYALVGATAMLGGMARITISLAVILMETTGESNWSVPIFLTVMTAKWVGDRFNKGIYDIHIDLRHIPLLEQRPERHTLNMRAEDIMATNTICMPSISRVGDVLQKLESCSHGAFPVLEPATGRFLGLVDRVTLSHVLGLGKDHDLFRSSLVDLLRKPTDTLPFQDMMKHKFPVPFSVSEIRASFVPEDLDQVVDLLPYTNVGAYTVKRGATVMRCHTLFRSMGLRHLPVVEEDQTVCGIISRKELVAAAEAEESPRAGHEAAHCSENDDGHDVEAPPSNFESSPRLLGRRPAPAGADKSEVKKDGSPPSPKALEERYFAV